MVRATQVQNAPGWPSPHSSSKAPKTVLTARLSAKRGGREMSIGEVVLLCPPRKAVLNAVVPALFVVIMVKDTSAQAGVLPVSR